HVVDAQLREVLRGARAGPGEVPELGLGQPTRLGLAEGELDSRVAVAFRRLQLHDVAGPGLDHRHGDDAVVLVPDLGHAELAPEDPFGRHVLALSGSALASRERSARKDPGGAWIGCAARSCTGHGAACTDVGWRARKDYRLAGEPAKHVA